MILRTALHPDCLDLVTNLRDCDRQELALSGGDSDETKVIRAWHRSPMCEAILTPDHKLAGIWGVQPLSPGVGSIWMLGTPALESIPLSFLRACRPSILKAHKQYPTLACAPWRDNALHLAWLKWLGFTPNDVGHQHFIPHYRHV